MLMMMNMNDNDVGIPQLIFPSSFSINTSFFEEVKIKNQPQT